MNNKVQNWCAAQEALCPTKHVNCFHFSCSNLRQKCLFTTIFCSALISSWGVAERNNDTSILLQLWIAWVKIILNDINLVLMANEQKIPSVWIKIESRLQVWKHSIHLIVMYNPLVYIVIPSMKSRHPLSLSWRSHGTLMTHQHKKKMQCNYVLGSNPKRYSTGDLH